MGRLVSAVSGLAALGFATGAIQILSTPSRGAIQASHSPFGLTRPATLLGLPNSFALSIRGTSGACAKAGAASAMNTLRARRRRRMTPPLNESGGRMLPRAAGLARTPDPQFGPGLLHVPHPAHAGIFNSLCALSHAILRNASGVVERCRMASVSRATHFPASRAAAGLFAWLTPPP